MPDQTNTTECRHDWKPCTDGWLRCTKCPCVVALAPDGTVRAYSRARRRASDKIRRRERPSKRGA